MPRGLGRLLEATGFGAGGGPSTGAPAVPLADAQVTVCATLRAGQPGFAAVPTLALPEMAAFTTL